jgi:hypothetical protein
VRAIIVPVIERLIVVDIAAPRWSDDAFVLVRNDGTVVVASMVEGPQHTLATVWESGGQRVALGQLGERPVVVAGAWNRHGIRAYDAETAAPLWDRRDRTHVQHIHVLEGGLVALSYEGQPSVIVDLETGHALWTIRGAREVWPGPDRTCIVAGRGWVALADLDRQRVGARIPVESFAVLDTFTTTDQVGVSEAAGPFRILDHDGAELGRYGLDGRHLLRVARDPVSQTWAGLELAHEHGGHWLVRLDDTATLIDRRPTSMGFLVATFDSGKGFLHVAPGAVEQVSTSSFEAVSALALDAPER